MYTENARPGVGVVRPEDEADEKPELAFGVSIIGYAPIPLLNEEPSGLVGALMLEGAVDTLCLRVGVERPLSFYSS